MHEEAKSRTVGRDPHIVVIGGGVIGVCTAYFLARREARVTLLQRGEVADGASRGNAGMISPGHPPINAPGRGLQALRSLRDPLSPLYVAPRWDPGLFRWLWSFSRWCSEQHLEYSMRSLAPLGLATPELFDEIVDTERLDCDYRRSGYLEICRTPRGLENVRKESSLIARHGFEARELSREELREREPTVRSDVAGGFVHAEGSTVNPGRFVVALAEAATRRGAVIRPHTPIDRIEVGDGRVVAVRTEEGERVLADVVITATGSYGGRLLGDLGCGLPIQPAKGYHEDRDPARAGTPPLSLPCLLVENSVFCTPMDDFVRFAGTLEFSGLNHEVRPERLGQLMRSASLYYDGVAAAAPMDVWVGLRPCTPDGLPVVGQVPGIGGLYAATGHGMLGLTLGPVTGKLLSEQILDGSASLPLAPFDPGRFLR